jgi:hypothetical protein
MVTTNCRFISDYIFLESRTFIPRELEAAEARLLYKYGFVLWYNTYKTKGKKKTQFRQ